MRSDSLVNKSWWDYTTLDHEILRDAVKLSISDMKGLSREGFRVVFHDSLETFFLAEAMEYIKAWKFATSDRPCGICGPIGPINQLPLVAELINSLEVDLRSAHFWGMDEWIVEGNTIDKTSEISFERTNRKLMFNRINSNLAMPEENIHFPSKDNIKSFSQSFGDIDCLVMQGGQGDAFHWAFNDPVKREGKYKDVPPSIEEYRNLGTRTVELHPLTVLQNANLSYAGDILHIPKQALTVGPIETWKAKTVSIWHPGFHANPFSLRLSALMISKKIVDTAVPISLLADHKDVVFHYCEPNIRECRGYIGL